MYCTICFDLIGAGAVLGMPAHCARLRPEEQWGSTTAAIQLANIIISTVFCG
jgi:hypothetical protein